jgi:hypothetical protein
MVFFLFTESTKNCNRVKDSYIIDKFGAEIEQVRRRYNDVIV